MHPDPLHSVPCQAHPRPDGRVLHAFNEWQAHAVCTVTPRLHSLPPPALLRDGFRPVGG